MSNFDPRLMRVSVEVGNNLRQYEGLAMQASIIKSSTAIHDEAQVTIANLARDVRNQLLTETSPYTLNYIPKKLRIEAGRASTGYFTVYEGDITRTSISQPPNIITAINAKSLNFAKGRVVTMSTADNVPLKTIAKRIAEELKLNLIFEATDRPITNFHFDGSSTGLIQRLAECGGINVYNDGKSLIVVNIGAARANVVHKLTEETGLIGDPELTDIGVRVRFMLDPNAQVKGTIALESKNNPQLSGNYTIYTLTHMLANREPSWYSIAECWRPGRLDLTTGIPVIFNR